MNRQHGHGTIGPLDLDAIAADLYSAVLSDGLDAVGHRNHALRSAIRSLDPHIRLAGFAVTIEIVPAYDVPVQPYAGLIATIDALGPDTVPILAVAGEARSGLWGELFSTAAQARGARGAVIDGPLRDADKITGLRFPVFADGTNPLDVRGRMEFHAAGRPVEIDGIRVEPGDLLFGDRDGVVVVPRDLIAEVVGGSYKKVGLEREARVALGAGAYLQGVWDRLGVL